MHPENKNWKIYFLQKCPKKRKEKREKKSTDRQERWRGVVCVDFEIQDLRFEIQDLRFEIQDFEIQDSEF